MGVLGHASALISIKENVINVERSGDKRLGVSIGNLHVVGLSGVYRLNSEKALIKRADFDVNLDFVVLKGNKRKGKTRVAAEPELKRNVKSSFWKSFARGAYSFRD